MSSSPVSTLPTNAIGANLTSSASTRTNSESEKDCSVISESIKSTSSVVFPQFQQSPSKENDQPLSLPPVTIQGHNNSDTNIEKGPDLTEPMTSAAEAILTNSQWDILLLLTVFSMINS